MWWFQRFSCFVTTGFAAEKCVTDARTYSLRDGRTETDGLKVSELLQGGGGSPRHRCQTAAQSDHRRRAEREGVVRTSEVENQHVQH